MAARKAGAFGIALIVGWFLWAGFATLRIGKPENRALALGALAALACFALQSCLDYPLRNQTMLGVAGLMVLLLAKAGREPRGASA